jgi:hypothetical protein
MMNVSEIDCALNGIHPSIIIGKVIIKLLKEDFSSHLIESIFIEILNKNIQNA